MATEWQIWIGVAGAFGSVARRVAQPIVVHLDLRVALTGGSHGVYTTFSTLALETFDFAETRA